jgi:RNA polymerase sigma factor (sigma-70 family)
MSKIIYKEQGFDISDEGKQAKQMEDRAVIDEALTKLTQKERKIMELIEFGYSHRQICREMKISPNTIRITLDKVFSIIR